MTQHTCSCGVQLRIPAGSIGKKVKCPRCGESYLAWADENTMKPTLVPVAEQVLRDAGVKEFDSNDPFADPFGDLDAAQPAPALRPMTGTYAGGRSASQQWYQPQGARPAEPLFRPGLFLAIAAGTIAFCLFAVGAFWAVRKIRAQLAAQAQQAQTVSAPRVPAAPVELPDSNDKLNQLYQLQAGANDSTPLLIDATASLDRQAFTDWLKKNPMGIGETIFCSLPNDTEKHIALARGMVAEYVQSLLSAHAASAQGAHARYATDFSNGNDSFFREGKRMRNLCKLLLVEACLRAAEGNSDGCVDSLVAAIRCSQSFMGHPTIAGDGTRLVSLVNTQNCLTQLLGRYEFTDEQLDKLRNELRGAAESDQSAYCMAGSLGLSLISMRANKLDNLIDEDDGTPEEQERIRQTLRNPTQRDQDYLIEKGKELVNACKLPYPERLDEFDAIGKELDKAMTLPIEERPHAAVMVLLPHLKYAQVLARVRSILDMGQLMLAIEKYRHLKGRVPSRLAELVPSHLDRIPADPFDGQPLRYVPSAAAYLLYSVGENRKDDAGKDDKRDTFDIACEIALGSRERPRSVASSTQLAARPADPWVEKLRETGETKDLLTDLPFGRRTTALIAGSWSSQSSGGITVLESKATSGAGYLQLADHPPENYRLKIEVQIISGQGSFNVALPVRDNMVLLVLDGWDQRISGLNMVKGRSGAGNETTYPSPVFKSGETNYIEVSVTRDGIYATVNGNRVISWRGDASDLSMERLWPSDRHKVWIGNWQTHYKVSRFELVELSRE